MRLSNRSRQKYSAGDITNLESVDLDRVEQSVHAIQLTWSAGVQIAIAMVMLWQQLGPAAFAGVGLLVLLMPLVILLAYFGSKFQEKIMEINGISLFSDY